MSHRAWVFEPGEVLLTLAHGIPRFWRVNADGALVEVPPFAAEHQAASDD